MIFNWKRKLNPSNIKAEDVLFKKFEPFTMIPREIFELNILLAAQTAQIAGAVVECGVWKGGMISAIAERLGDIKNYYLYDSFKGLPSAKEIDGEAANKWQQNITGKYYYDNCTASKEDVIEAISLTKVPKEQFHIAEGWFSDTMKENNIPKEIALLRLDADWYESTMLCLEAMFSKVTMGGIIIIDDYYTWDGCSKAVHDFLSIHQRAERVQQLNNVVAFIKKGSC